MHNKIVFNKPILIGNEEITFKELLKNNRFSHGGAYQKMTESFLEEMFGTKVLLTKSCTAALEMCALLLNLTHDDEVIVPAYTFSSTANAFLLRNCKIRFADSMKSHPNICVESISKLITKKTKVLVVVHYAGTPCDLDKIVDICKKNDIILIEDSAQAINCTYKGKPLGTFGDFGTLSFHDTKNITCGEGGALIINNLRFFENAKNILTHGNDKFSVQDHNKGYNWRCVGSSFGLSELHACFLYNNLLKLDEIQQKRDHIYNMYKNSLVKYGENNFSINSHIFFLLLKIEDVDRFISHMSKNGVEVSKHFKSLSDSYFNEKKDDCLNARKFENRLVRIPIYYNLTDVEVKRIIFCVNRFYE